MDITRSVRAYYKARALKYDETYGRPELAKELRYLRHYIDRVFASRDVFELACGTGYWTEVLSRSANSVLATDINNELLAIARSKLFNQKARFRKVDAYNLPPFSEIFSGGFSAFWWSHVPKERLGLFLERFNSLFATGAQIVFVDNRYDRATSAPLSRSDRNGNTFQIRKLGKNRRIDLLKNFPAESELRSAVAKYASIIHIKNLKYYWILHYRLSPKTAR
jgi:SAM-dependent methyltransferase